MTDVNVTQVSLEHWLTTNADARTTQVVLEHWGTVTGTGVQALVTSVVLEHWASVREVSRGMPIVTMVM